MKQSKNKDKIKEEKTMELVKETSEDTNDSVSELFYRV